MRLWLKKIAKYAEMLTAYRKKAIIFSMRNERICYSQHGPSGGRIDEGHENDPFWGSAFDDSIARASLALIKIVGGQTVSLVTRQERIEWASRIEKIHQLGRDGGIQALKVIQSGLDMQNGLSLGMVDAAIAAIKDASSRRG